LKWSKLALRAWLERTIKEEEVNLVVLINAGRISTLLTGVNVSEGNGRNDRTGLD
jgi:hypothetical protein